MGGGKGGGSTTNYTERPLTSQELALLDTQNTAIKQQMSLADAARANEQEVMLGIARHRPAQDFECVLHQRSAGYGDVLPVGR